MVHVCFRGVARRLGWHRHQCVDPISQQKSDRPRWRLLQSSPVLLPVFHCQGEWPGRTRPVWKKLFSRTFLFRLPSPLCSQAPSHKYSAHSSHVTNVSFLHNDSHLISTGGKDTSIMQWRLVEKSSLSLHGALLSNSTHRKVEHTLSVAPPAAVTQKPDPPPTANGTQSSPETPPPTELAPPASELTPPHSECTPPPSDSTVSLKDSLEPSDDTATPSDEGMPPLTPPS